jgi:hypothetical protein
MAQTPNRSVGHRIESQADDRPALEARFSPHQIAILEKLNRADHDHLDRLRDLVVPEAWLDDELAYSPAPMRYEPAAGHSSLLVV